MPHTTRRTDTAPDEFEDPAAAYASLVALEQTFLECVHDDEIRAAFLGWRKGEKQALCVLVRIAAEGWSRRTGATARQVKADRAIEICDWFRTVTQ